MGVNLTGHIDVPPGRLAAIEAALPDHIRLTRAEPGWSHFDVWPDPSAAGRFLVSEEFADRGAFAAHQVRAASSDWARASDGLSRDYRIEETDG